jgi:hypothetical protein
MNFRLQGVNAESPGHVSCLSLKPVLKNYILVEKLSKTEIKCITSFSNVSYGI